MGLKQVAIAVDQLANTLLGGQPDETLSARAWRLRNKPYWKTFRKIIDFIFFWDPDHCYTSYVSEVLRKQLPGEYQ